MRERALDVAQDALDGREVLFTRIVHMKTNLLNRVRDVGARKGEVLESSSKTPVLRGIGHGRAGNSGELRRGVNRCRG